MQGSSEEVIELFRNILGTVEVDENSEVGRPHQWNSLHHIEIIMALEKRFSVKIGALAVAKLTSIRAITDFLSLRGEV